VVYFYNIPSIVFSRCKTRPLALFKSISSLPRDMGTGELDIEKFQSDSIVVSRPKV